jgi:spore coat polysaccharide biosynthesis protein SpsF
MKVAAIIQARMGSTRLPGKVLKNMLGKPMLYHLVTRVRNAKYVDDVVVATTVNKEDDAIERFAVASDFGIYRGSQDDIVDRILNAGKKYNADIVVRIWGDCPLIDPNLIDKVLSRFVDGCYEYANNFNPPTYPVCMSFEVYRLEALERIWNATNDMFYRQYPFEYVYANGAAFKTMYDRNDKDLSAMHLTVDYVEDFELVSEVFRNLDSEKGIFDLGDILRFLGSHPELNKAGKKLARNIEYKKDKELRRRQR